MPVYKYDALNKYCPDDWLTLPQNYSQRILAADPYNLLLYWRLNEAAGAVANDYRGGDRPGTAAGVTWGQAGIGDGNTAALFDGNNDNIWIAHNAALHPAQMTFLFWFKYSSITVWDVIFSKFTNAYTNGFGLYEYTIPSNKLIFQFGVYNVNLVTVDAPTANVWHCIACRADTNCHIFVDGVKTTGAVAVQATTAERVTLMDTSDNILPAQGTVQHFAMWGSALPDATIIALSTL